MSGNLPLGQGIQVGDLVRVVKVGCEHGENLIGRIFIVPSIHHGLLHCELCDFHAGSGSYVMDPIFEGMCFDLAWLKKIPPIEDLQDTEHREEVSA